MRIVRGPGDDPPRIADTALRVSDVAVAYEREGSDPEAIARQYPELSLADVHRALAFYYDHRETFDAIARRREE